ncbi:MAG: hypothetical protein AAB592_01805 [Patescibacteria group bacterium]
MTKETPNRYENFDDSQGAGGDERQQIRSQYLKLVKQYSSHPLAPLSRKDTVVLLASVEGPDFDVSKAREKLRSLPEELKSKQKDAIRGSYRKLVSQYADKPDSPLSADDTKAILSPIEQPNFDIEFALSMLGTLEESLKKGKEIFDRLNGFLKKEPYSSLYKDRDPRKLTYIDKVALLKDLELTQTVYEKMQKWKAAGLLLEDNILHKIATDFVKLSSDDKRKRADTLEYILEIKDRKALHGIFEKLPEIMRKGHKKAFEAMPLDEQPEFVKMLFVQAYKTKISQMQLPGEEGLTLFAPDPYPSAASYRAWFEGQKLADMPRLLENSDLDDTLKPERKLYVKQMTEILKNVKSPITKARVRDEFNNSDLTMRGSLIRQYKNQPPKEDTEPVKKTESSQEDTSAADKQGDIRKKRALFQEALEEQVSGTPNTELEKEARVYSLFREVAERRRRAEVRYNVQTVDKLQEAVSGNSEQVKKEQRLQEGVTAFDRDKSEIEHETGLQRTDDDKAEAIGKQQPKPEFSDSIRLKETQLRTDTNAMSALRRELKPGYGDHNAILTSTRLINREGREIFTTEALHSELPRIQDGIAAKILNLVSTRAHAQGLELNAKDRKDGVDSLDWDKLHHKTFEQAA